MKSRKQRLYRRFKILLLTFKNTVSLSALVHEGQGAGAIHPALSSRRVAGMEATYVRVQENMDRAETLQGRSL